MWCSVVQKCTTLLARKLLSREELLPLKGLSIHGDLQTNSMVENLNAIVDNLAALESLNPIDISSQCHTKIEKLFNHCILVAPSGSVEPVNTSERQRPSNSSIVRSTQVMSGEDVKQDEEYHTECRSTFVGKRKQPPQNGTYKIRKRKQGRLNKYKW